MEDIYVGRQPILNLAQKTVAYELLYRAGDLNIFPVDLDGTEASIRLISNVFTELGLQEIAAGLPVFINFNREMLLADIPGLNVSSVVIEILEDVVVDKHVLNACLSLKQKGFRLALDDFVLNSHTRQLLKMVSIIKIDWQADPVEHIQKTCNVLKPLSIKLLAEKIETEKEFLLARDLGFEFFQGFFFARPAILKTRAVSVLPDSLLKLMGSLQGGDVDFDEIEKIISRDAALSFKLLKIINSASISLPRQVESVKQALILLGEKELKRWMTLLMLTQINGRNPAELLSTSFIRGLFGEKIAHIAGQSTEAPSVFLAGLLSLLDAMLRRPMPEIVRDLPLSNSIRQALDQETGILGTYILLMKAYEKGQRDMIRKYADRLELDMHQVVTCYVESVRESGIYLQSSV